MREFQEIEESFEPVEVPLAAEGLRAAVPHVLGGGDSEKLEEEVGRHRVLLIRGGAVIAVTTLISIGGALFIHSIFAGVFVLGFLLNWGSIGGGNRGPGAKLEGDGDGAILVVDDGIAERPSAAAALGKPAAGPKAEALASLAALPPLPEISLNAVAVAAPQIAEAPMPEPVDLGTVRVPVPANVVRAAVPENLVVDPPAVANANMAAVGAVNGGRAGTAVAVAGGGGEGEEEPMFSQLKEPGGGGGGGTGRGSGSGTGRGSGRGSGLDRGPSGADRPEPMVLDSPQPAASEIPMWLALHPPEKAVTFSVMVLENGAVGEITVIRSSGRPEVDAFYRDLLSRWKYSPAVVGGKRVARAKEISFDPRI